MLKKFFLFPMVHRKYRLFQRFHSIVFLSVFIHSLISAFLFIFVFWCFLSFLSNFFVSGVFAEEKQAPKEPKTSSYPNIILILADDMGYGDISCLNPEGKIKTPSLDRLAGSGIIFSDCHSPSSVCTPTRYGILTGRYNWRSRLKSGVLYGYDRPLIEPDRLTIASMLKTQGYQTACFGKWHLGLDWTLFDGKTPPKGNKPPQPADIDFSQPFKNGPKTLGFDYFFGISASLDMPPYVYLENDRVLELPTTEKNGFVLDRLRNHLKPKTSYRN